MIDKDGFPEEPKEPVNMLPEEKVLKKNPITDDDYMENMVSTVKTRFALSDYEANFLREVNSELRKPTPSTPSMIGDRLTKLDDLRVRLLSMIYMITDKESEFAYEYYEKYNSDFTRLVRMGRPSTPAIEAEIHNNAAMHKKKALLESFDAFKGMLFGYVKTIDGAKQTCYERARDR